MDAEPEVITFIVRLAVARGGRVAGIVERVRSGEKRRFREIEAIGPLIAAMLRGEADTPGQTPRASEPQGGKPWPSPD
jgi:hypothetical protein